MRLRYHPEWLDAVSVADEQIEYDGNSKLWKSYLASLHAAIDKGEIPVRQESDPNPDECYVYFYIRRDDYAAWRERKILPPPDWWLLEGEPAQPAVEQTPQKKPARGRPKDPNALSNRHPELEEAAKKAAAVLGGSPQRGAVVNYLLKNGYGAPHTYEGLIRIVKKTWWAPSEK